MPADSDRPSVLAATPTVLNEAAGIPAVLSSMLVLMLGPSAILLLSFGTFMPALHAQFGWSIPAISIGGSIIAIAIMFLSPLQGYLVDRFSARRAILLSVPVWGLSLIAMSFLPARIEIFYLACLLLPLAALGLWPLSHMKLATTWFDRHVGLAMGAINLSVGFAAALLPLLLGLAFVHVGWRGAYALLGTAVLLLVWPVAALWFRDGPRSRALPGAAAPLGIAFGEAVRTRVFWMMASNFFILGLISTGLLIHQVAILLDAGIDADRAIFVQSAIGLGSIVGRIGTGWLLDRVAVQKVGMATFAVAAFACFALASPYARDLAIPATAAVGIVIGSEFDILGVLIRRYQGIAAFGRLFGVVFSAFQLGGAIGAATLGFGRSGFGSYAPVLAVLGGLALLGGVTFAFFGPYRFAREGAAPNEISGNRG